MRRRSAEITDEELIANGDASVRLFVDMAGRKMLHLDQGNGCARTKEFLKDLMANQC